MANRSKAFRLLLTVIGGIGIAIGVTLIVKANVGADVTSVLFTGIAKNTPLSFEVASYVSTTLLLIVLRLIKANVGIGTVIMTLSTSFSIFATFVLIPEPPSALAVRILYFAVGTTVMALSVNIGFASGLGNGIYEALCSHISKLTGYKEPAIRTVWEASILTTGIILGGAFGVGTIVFVLSIGPLVAVFNKAIVAKI